MRNYLFSVRTALLWQFVFFGRGIGRSNDTNNNAGLFSMDAHTGEISWLTIPSTVVADNGAFGASFYRGK